MKKIFVNVSVTVVLCLFAGTIQAQNASAEPAFDVEACMNKAQSNMDMKICAGEEYSYQDRQLNKVYARLTAKLKKDSTAEGKEILNRVVSAQRAWIPFRDTTCSLESVDMLGGTGESLIYIGCMGRLTKERVKLLAEFEGNYTSWESGE